MNNLRTQIKRRSFDYIYMFVMVIYMGQMTHATRSMFSISGSANLLGIIIPNLLTLILVWRYRRTITLSKNLVYATLAVLIWMIAIWFKYDMDEARSALYIIYYIFIACLQVRIFGKRLFVLYEDIIVLIAKICLLLWILGVLLPPVADVYTLFPLTIDSDYRGMDGYNVLYIFCWNNDHKHLITRNAGCSWEPGSFACMLVIGILINLYQNGIKFRNNRKILWLLVALLSTQSTTGLSVTIVLYVYFALSKFSVKNVAIFLLVLVPAIYASFQLDYMGDKLTSQYAGANDVETQIRSIKSMTRYDHNYSISLPRFVALVFEYQNITKDPILGYGPTCSQSYFKKHVLHNAWLTGGSLKIFGRYGLILGSIFYYILFLSSKALAGDYNSRKKYGLLICFILISVSYDLFNTAVYMTFWFYGLFIKTEDKEVVRNTEVRL